jgi:hypothetical protein
MNVQLWLSLPAQPARTQKFKYTIGEKEKPASIQAQMKQ